MGGCCCCSSRRADVDNVPAYYYYPRATEERVPLSSAHNRTSSAISSGAVVVVDTNLETSSPDAYVPPPLPIPFDVAIGIPQTPVNGEEITCVDIREVSVETVNTESTTQETVDGITLGVPATCPPYKETESKIQTEIDLESTEDIDPKLSKEVFVPTEEEEDCPICLEEYDMENPQLVAKCEHHFHLACILEWMERSETCPVCNKEMVFDSTLD
ncbi:unnamed protein product [Cochlearia groenlandica]